MSFCIIFHTLKRQEITALEGDELDPFQTLIEWKIIDFLTFDFISLCHVLFYEIGTHQFIESRFRIWTLFLQKVIRHVFILHLFLLFLITAIGFLSSGRFFFFCGLCWFNTPLMIRIVGNKFKNRIRGKGDRGWEKLWNELKRLCNPKKDSSIS